MTLPDGSVATGAAEETAPKEEPSLSAEILALMRGEELPTPEPLKVEEETPTPTEEVPTPPEEETPSVEEETPEVATAPKGEVWPKSASKRVAEESERRRREQSRADKAESEREQWKERAVQLNNQLQEASIPRPTREDPLADVFDHAGLQKAKGHYLNIKKVATQALDENPTAEAIDIIVGKDKNGEPITESFTRKVLSDMKSDAENALSEMIPQRERILVDRSKADALAIKVYPQFTENDGDNEWAGFVRETLGAYPQLAKVPDIVMWLGHALEGRNVTVERLKKEMGKNGATGATAAGSPIARRILSNPVIKNAPPVSAARVPSQTIPRRGADVEAARKRMKANPSSDEAMEDFIDAKLFGASKKGYARIS
jgi:hypothetical protein